MTTFHHFAYGSNLSIARLRARCSSAQPLAVGFVRGRRLRFHKVGRDGTGKANAEATGRHDDVVWGVVYHIQLDQRSVLDRCESLGDGYQEAIVDVQIGKRRWRTFLYEAMPHRIDACVLPAPWYHDHLLVGAREHGLPVAYQRMLADQPTMYDPFSEAS
jgi:cation transport regulator ChaC